MDQQTMRHTHFAYKTATERQLARNLTAVLNLLKDVADSGIEHPADPPGIDWVTVQIDQETWDDIQEAVKAYTYG